jgi:hypothetical protein
MLDIWDCSKSKLNKEKPICAKFDPVHLHRVTKVNESPTRTSHDDRELGGLQYNLARPRK